MTYDPNMRSFLDRIEVLQDQQRRTEMFRRALEGDAESLNEIARGVAARLRLRKIEKSEGP